MVHRNRLEGVSLFVFFSLYDICPTKIKTIEKHYNLVIHNKCGKPFIYRFLQR